MWLKSLSYLTCLSIHEYALQEVYNTPEPAQGTCASLAPLQACTLRLYSYPQGLVRKSQELYFMTPILQGIFFSSGTLLPEKERFRTEHTEHSKTNIYVTLHRVEQSKIKTAILFLPSLFFVHHFFTSSFYNCVCALGSWRRSEGSWSRSSGMQKITPSNTLVCCFCIPAPKA